MRACWQGIARIAVCCLVVAALLSACAGPAEQVAIATRPALTAAPEQPSATAPTSPPLTPTAVPPTLVPPPTTVPESPTAAPATAPPSPTIVVSPTPPPATPLEGPALVAALERGGYVIAFRHAATDWSQRDTQHTRELWSEDDPRRMRQLSEAGRAQARAIGEAMRALGIPVGQLLASPYHRTQETAELLALGPVELSVDVLNMYAAEHVGGRAQVVATARRRLSSLPASATNTVIVTHGNVVQAAANISLQEGEAAIFAPNGVERFALVARVLPQEWAVLAQATSAMPTPQAATTASVCEPTPAEDLGRFYAPNALVRASVGQGYLLSGVVRSAMNCAPIPAARIELWLAGPDGTFDDEHRATVVADASGAYRFESNFPPAYDANPPHIFVRVTAPEHQTLVTRHYPIAGQTEGRFDLILSPE